MIPRLELVYELSSLLNSAKLTERNSRAFCKQPKVVELVEHRPLTVVRLRPKVLDISVQLLAVGRGDRFRFFEELELAL
jgi:hypothetical protein